MHITKTIVGLALAASFAVGPAMAQQRELVINMDRTSELDQKASQDLIDAFEAANPDIKVKWNNFDREGYKSAIRNIRRICDQEIADRRCAGYCGLVPRKSDGPICRCGPF